MSTSRSCKQYVTSICLWSLKTTWSYGTRHVAGLYFRVYVDQHAKEREDVVTDRVEQRTQDRQDYLLIGTCRNICDRLDTLHGEDACAH
jgi:hypothetical protein